jgi:glutamate synthase (NADPH/NADH) large chain
MSGGTAYLLDLNPARINGEMVDLEPLTTEDEALVRDLLERHVTATDSAVGRGLLADWTPQRFTKVMPRDYKNVLAARERALAEGLDVDESIMEAARG